MKETTQETKQADETEIRATYHQNHLRKEGTYLNRSGKNTNDYLLEPLALRLLESGAR